MSAGKRFWLSCPPQSDWATTGGLPPQKLSDSFRRAIHHRRRLGRSPKPNLKAYRLGNPDALPSTFQLKEITGEMVLWPTSTSASCGDRP